MKVTLEDGRILNVPVASHASDVMVIIRDVLPSGHETVAMASVNEYGEQTSFITVLGMLDFAKEMQIVGTFGSEPNG